VTTCRYGDWPAAVWRLWRPHRGPGSSESTLLIAIRRGQLGPSRPPVRSRAARQVGGEVLDVCLPTRAMRGSLVQG